MKKSLRIAFLGPSRSIKSRIVLQYIINHDAIDWHNSLIMLDRFSHDGCHEEAHKASLPAVEVGLKGSEEKILGALSAGDYDFLVVCGWGQKISPEILAKPNIAPLNCHGSYLPDYKGASAYKHYWANCEEKAGVTVHYMSEQIDQGNIVAQKRFDLRWCDTPKSILKRSAELTAPLLVEAIYLAANGYEGFPHSGGRYFRKVSFKKAAAHRVWNCTVGRYLGIKVSTPVR